VDEARAAVNEIVAYFEEARDAAVQTKTHLKNVEIAARKVSVKLSDIKRTLAFDDQAPVEQAVRRLEDVRTVLLKEMFSDKRKGGR
jgi:CHASE3 domain sensor protein